MVKQRVLTLIFAAALGACAKQPDLMTYEEFQRLDFAEPYIIRLCAKSGPGRVVYFGSRHTNQPTDSQIRMIEEEIEGLQPDLVLTESVLPDMTGLTRLEAITKFGEPNFAGWLARSKGIAVESVDPPRDVEVKGLLDAGYTVAQLKVFYTLRQVAQSQGTTLPVTIEEAVTRRLQNLGSRGLPGKPETLDEFEAEIRKMLPELADWRTITREYFYPGRQNPHHITNDIQTASNNIRDRYQAQRIAQFVNQGRKVFAIAGSSHAVIQERLLRHLLDDDCG